MIFETAKGVGFTHASGIKVTDGFTKAVAAKIVPAALTIKYSHFASLLGSAMGSNVHEVEVDALTLDPTALTAQGASTGTAGRYKVSSTAAVQNGKFVDFVVTITDSQPATGTGAQPVQPVAKVLNAAILSPTVPAALNTADTVTIKLDTAIANGFVDKATLVT